MNVALVLADRWTLLLSVIVAAALSACDSCRKDGASSGGGGEAGAGGAQPAASFAEDDAGEAPSTADARRRFRDAEPGVDAAALAATIDPACTGKEIDLAAAVVDARCAIGAAEAKRLREPFEVDGGAAPLEQKASRDADGRIVVRVVSSATKPLVLPLSYHVKLPAFTALAENDKRELYELEAPKLETKSEGKPHIARIVLPPGGVAFARAVVSPKVSKRIVPSCAGAGPCGPAQLDPGKYVLHVGQLVVDVEAGAPAKIDWTIP